MALAQEGQGQVDPQMVEQVAAMLSQGATPEELIAQGVPPEIIQMAIQMLQVQQQPQGPMGGGLAVAQGLV